MSVDPYSLIIRPNTSDEGTWHDVFDEDKAYHRPPSSVKDPKRILDFGAYVGYTAIDLSSLFPGAKIIAYEPCAENFMTMFNNLDIADMYDRVYPKFKGVAARSGRGTMTGSAFNCMKFQFSESGVDVVTMDQAVGRGADYVKMDVEGMEKDILKSGKSWANRVKCIKVELHDDYTVEEALMDLKLLGFKSAADTNHPYCVVGER